MMKRLLLLVLLVIGFGETVAAAAGFSQVNPEAERHYAEKSFSKAHELYAGMATNQLAAAERRWVEFRRADTLWRGSLSAHDEQSVAARQQAREWLLALIQKRDRKEEQDQVWAEVHESLGMMPVRTEAFEADRRPGFAEEARNHFEKVLDWWAGSSDLEPARRRYLQLVWNIFKGVGDHPVHTALPDEVLENAIRIAVTDNDRATGNFLLAKRIMERGSAYEIERAAAHFEAVLAIGKAAESYDDALFTYAQWLAYSGETTWDSDGNAVPKGNPKKAVELFRRLTREFSGQESPYHRQALDQMQGLAAVELNLMVSSIFPPGTQAEAELHFRNVRQVEFILRRVDLLRDFKLREDPKPFAWGDSVEVAAAEVVKRWTQDFGDRAEFQPHQATIPMEGKLPAGAYLLEAAGGGKSAREIILVTDLALVVKASRDRTLFYVCQGETGAPVAGAEVKFWEAHFVGQKLSVASRTGVSGKDGLVEFPAGGDGKVNRAVHSTVGIAVADGRPAVAFPQPFYFQPTPGVEAWRMFTVTDRPAYRPGETVHWKTTARALRGDVYATPAGAKARYAINDPHGVVVKEGEITLNSFGSAWGDFALPSDLPLGECQIVFTEVGRKQMLGNGRFRVEEYKLPEFKVAVRTPEANGRAKAFRLGETVEVVVQADYYFGGAVGDAAVHVVVRKGPLYRVYQPARQFGWLYSGNDFGIGRWRGQGEIALEKDLRTDAEGRAVVTLETAAFGSEDIEFTIEARVTDAARREIIGNGKVRVTRHRYQVHASAAHSLHRPGDKAQVDFKALDANDQPVAAEGQIRVTRDFWREIWTDPQGREVKGEELRKLRQAGPFPPDVRWRMVFQGYEKEAITTATAKTDQDGSAAFSFTAAREGYYRVSWLSENQPGAKGPPIKAETTVWVADNRSSELGYRHGGLEIVVDKDTFRAGQKAAVMLHTPANDRWVLLTTGTDRILKNELIHMDGTVKLIELEIGEEHVPNFFLQAAMVNDYQIHTDQKEIVVPPVKHFLQVEIKPDQPAYRVREEGRFVIVTKDHEGKPVPAEVSLGVVDESVFYIQEDYAGDPRQFFFGAKRPQAPGLSSSFQWRNFRRADLQEARRDEVDEIRAAGGAVRSMDRAFPTRSKVASMTGFRKNVTMLGMADSVRPSDAAFSMSAPSAPEAAPLTRTDFRSTMFWQPDITTDADGTATAVVKFPDSTTAWKGTARAATAGNQFGTADATVRTTQPLIVRLQAPRFFVAGDEAVISAIINNTTDQPVEATPAIEIEGLKLLTTEARAKLTIPANGEARVDWRALAENAGTARIKVSARAKDAGDAMERAYPVHEHGIEKYLSHSGILSSGEALVKINLPAARKKDSTRLSFQVTPSLAVTMLDALPYLIDYPYGCVEQTMSRFLPAAIVAQTLKETGLQPEDVANRIFGGIEAAHAAKTQPKGKQGLEQLGKMIEQGLARLHEMRHADGGWGWWAGGESDPYMTAYVVWGLSLARQAGQNFLPEEQMIERGASFLEGRLTEAENQPDQQAWLLLALAAANADGHAPTPVTRKALDNIWSKREQMNAYAKALVALAMHGFGEVEKARVLIRNLEDGVRRDSNPGASVLLKGGEAPATAHWGKADSFRHWSEGGIETTAFVLRALLAVQPDHPLVQPTVHWLVKNRRGAQWSNTRDTAIALLALTGYLKQSGELKAAVEYEIQVNGQTLAARKITDVLAAPARFEIPSGQIRDGDNEIRLVRKAGDNRLYFSADAVFFSLEEPVPAAGSELFVRRQYFRLTPRATLLKGNEYDRVPLKEGDVVQSGDRIEAALTIEAKNDYEYLIFEDLKPAGFEAVEIRSGGAAYARQVKSASAHRTGPLDPLDYADGSRWIYREIRDRKIASFIDRLPQGFWEIRHEFRAETPGRFHALPALGHAMYVPEIRCNSAELRLEIKGE